MTLMLTSPTIACHSAFLAPPTAASASTTVSIALSKWLAMSQGRSYSGRVGFVKLAGRGDFSIGGAIGTKRVIT